MQKFLIVIEKAVNNHSAYSPDLPGCIAAAQTIEEVEKKIYKAIEMHIEEMKEDNISIPSSTAITEFKPLIQGILQET
ncbi:MAG: hypothetical protein CVV49_20750 [Spirochaetae bacterium HGW-Spirochaetae-5]|nr:MAG: hypothetical protein CVV49_20750 [Spirochaetae bacterium HGW-Spirochaetae-5]